MPWHRLRVRLADCDAFGHANNAAYLSYLIEAFAACLPRSCHADWTPQGEHRWHLRQVSAEYHTPAAPSTLLDLHLWLLQADDASLTLGAEVRSDLDGPAHLRARLTWERRRRPTDQAAPLPPDLPARFQDQAGTLPRPFQAPEPSSEAHRYTWEHRVGQTEVGPTGLAHPQALLAWVEEAEFAAAEAAGWPLERMLQADFLTLQTRHDAAFNRLPQAGERVRLVSHLAEVRRLRGTWIHDLVALPTGELLARDLSTGVFLNRAGRPATPPAGLMEDLVRGGPT